MSWMRLVIYGGALAIIAVFVLRTEVQVPVTATNEVPDFVSQKEVAVLSFPEATDAPQKSELPKIHLEKPADIPVVEESTPAPIAMEQKRAPDDGAQVARIQNPYPFPQLSDEVINVAARASLVNIFCNLKNGESVSGSGIIIDPRGVILTNAHIGQYVLLSEASEDISCLGRTGAPARAVWKLRILFMPRQWVTEHAKDLKVERPTGTGEHDYAFVFVEDLDQTKTPTLLPFAEHDTREGISFEGDEVLLASYPAGFVGSFTVQNNLYPATTFARVQELFTFENSTVDLLSLGGVILAQGGSSGGGVFNRWGRLVGLIVTTSDGATTAERDLRAVTLAHADRSLRAHTGIGLAEFLNDDVNARADFFRTGELPALAQLLISQIPQ